MMVLLQYAEDDGEIVLYHIWKEPVWKTLELLERIATSTVVLFNAVFDWFHVVKIHTIWSLLPPDWIPEDHIEQIALIEPLGQEGQCIKPVDTLDLLLHSRRGPYQALMAREDVRIRRVPTALAYALAQELEQLIQIDGIYFARSADKDAPRWHVYDVKNRDGDIDQHFKDVCLRFNAAGGLKYLAEHALGYEPKFHFKDVEVDRKYLPVEYGFAPTALAVSTPELDWAVYKPNKKGEMEIKGYAWPAVIKHHIDHWYTSANAQEYARDDIVYTRELCYHFAKLANVDVLPSGDDDSVLACAVPVVRWRGFRINLEGIKELLAKAEAVMATSPVNINKPAEVRKYIAECMDDMEIVIIEESTKKAKLISVSNWKIDTDHEEDDTGAEGLQGWKVNHSEECSKCDSTGTCSGKTCARCEGTGQLQSGIHPASKRAAEILVVKAAAKERELYHKLLLAGKFHASINVIGALSGRQSGGDGLNAHGIKHAKEVRQMFPLWRDKLEVGEFRSKLEATLSADEFAEVWGRMESYYSADTGYQLSGGDFDSFEVTIADAVYKDPGMTQTLISGEKIHAHFACCMYPEETYESVLASEGSDFDMYTKGKSGFFGFLYFGDWTTLVKNFGILKEVAQQAETTFLRRYPGIAKARQRIVDMFQSMKQEESGGAVLWQDPADSIQTLLGFPRFFTLENMISKALFGLARKPPKIWRETKIKVVRRDRVQTAGGAVASALYGAAFQIQAACTRAAGNHEIQGTGAEITKRAQRRIWDLQPAGVHDLMVIPLSIHDEIMCPCRASVVEQVVEMVRETVEHYRDLIPLIGMTWFKKMATWAGKKGGDVEGEVKVRSERMLK